MNCTDCKSYNRGYGSKQCLKCPQYRDVQLQSIKRPTISFASIPQSVFENIADNVEDEMSRQTLDAIASLPPICSAIISLIYVSKLKHKEVCELLNISRTTLHAKKNLSLEIIKKSLQIIPANLTSSAI